jgi:hypothetical protein
MHCCCVASRNVRSLGLCVHRYFGNVCELDIIFNFHKAYYILDELFIGGYLQVGCVCVCVCVRACVCVCVF